MSVVAFIRRMLDAGFTHEDALRAAEAFEATAGDMIDVQAERRREKDRERKRNARLRNSAESAETEETLSPSPSPQTPQPRPHTRGDIYTHAREAGPSKAEIAKGFVAFWAAYPRRKSKDAAAKAFEKAMRRIEDPDPLAIILAGIERALPGWDDPNFIPYPASWLNAGGWEDEPPTPKTTTPTSPRNDRPDRFAAKQANYQSALAGADWADQVLVARRGF